MAKVVVFGADGFIGKHLTLALAKSKDDTIVAFDRFTEYRSGETHEFSKHENIVIMPGDFFNRDEVRQALSDKVDYVFHLVSATTPASSINDPMVDIDTNLRASVDLFEACIEAGIKKIVFPSSGGTVYGDTEKQTLDENTTPYPRSPYGIIKLTIEHYLRYFQSTFGLDYIVYRIANPYGPGQNIYGKQGVIPIFMHKILEHEPLEVYGDGSMIRDYIYISDLIDMILASYRLPSKYREYNLGSGQGESVNDIIAAIEKCTGAAIDKTFILTPPTFVQKIVLDTTRFTNEFGVAPRINIDEGIERTWNYVRDI